MIIDCLGNRFSFLKGQLNLHLFSCTLCYKHHLFSHLYAVSGLSSGRTVTVFHVFRIYLFSLSLTACYSALTHDLWAVVHILLYRGVT